MVTKYWIIIKLLSLFIGWKLNDGELTSLFHSGYIPSLDVGFLADSSDTVNWQKTLNAISAIIANFDVSQSGTHVGFIPFSSSAAVAVPFPTAGDRPYSAAVVRGRINSIAQLGGSDRRVGLAFQVARDDLFTSRNRSRPATKQVRFFFFYHKSVRNVFRIQ